MTDWADGTVVVSTQYGRRTIGFVTRLATRYQFHYLSEGRGRIFTTGSSAPHSGEHFEAPSTPGEVVFAATWDAQNRAEAARAELAIAESDLEALRRVKDLLND